MKQPLLTIAIPTYNRENILDKQLAWAVNAIGDRWEKIELIVSDNGSPDHTPNVCQKWHQETQGRLRVFRQPQNMGLPRNAAFCIQEAQGEFIWLVSDDDIIADHTLDWLIDLLSNSTTRANLSLVHFNLTIQRQDGSFAHERVHPFFEDRHSDPGRPLFEECSKLADISMILSSSAYRSQVAREAVAKWPGMARNLAFPTYLAGYAAAHGAMIVRAQPSLVCIQDSSSFIPFGPIVDYYDVPEVYWLLSREGYSTKFIRPKILGRLVIFKFMLRYPHLFLSSLKFYLRAFRMKPTREEAAS